MTWNSDWIRYKTVVTETDIEPHDNVYLPNFACFGKDHTSRSGKGVANFVKKWIKNAHINTNTDNL